MTPASQVPGVWRLDASRRLALIAMTSMGVVGVVLCTGGFEFDLSGLRVSARSPAGPFLVAIVAAALAWLASPVVSGRRDLIAWTAGSSSIGPPLAALLAILAQPRVSRFSSGPTCCRWRRQSRGSSALAPAPP